MKNISKWALIIWSVFCVVGICVGIFNAAQQFGESKDEWESAGQFLGLGCGLGIWFMIWIALAGPLLVIYLVSGKNEKKKKTEESEDHRPYH